MLSPSIFFCLNQTAQKHGTALLTPETAVFKLYVGPWRWLIVGFWGRVLHFIYVLLQEEKKILKVVKFV